MFWGARLRNTQGPPPDTLPPLPSRSEPKETWKHTRLGAEHGSREEVDVLLPRKSGDLPSTVTS